MPEKVDPKFRRILVLDDDDEIREMLKVTLETEGFKIKAVRDGRDVLKHVSGFGPHLVISDVMMPGGGGYDVLRNLQSDPEAKEIPVIVMTGYAFDASTKDMMAQEPNVKSFIDKPIRPHMLLSKVHDILQTKSKDEQVVQKRSEEQNVRELDMGEFEK